MSKQPAGHSSCISWVLPWIKVSITFIQAKVVFVWNNTTWSYLSHGDNIHSQNSQWETRPGLLHRSWRVAHDRSLSSTVGCLPEISGDSGKTPRRAGLLWVLPLLYLTVCFTMITRQSKPAVLGNKICFLCMFSVLLCFVCLQRSTLDIPRKSQSSVVGLCDILRLVGCSVKTTLHISRLRRGLMFQAGQCKRSLICEGRWKLSAWGTKVWSVLFHNVEGCRLPSRVFWKLRTDFNRAWPQVVWSLKKEYSGDTRKCLERDRCPHSLRMSSSNRNN